MSRYDNIIDCQRPISPHHKPMSRSARAAQFAPYAAVVGHQETIATNESTSLHQADPEYTIVLDPDADSDPLMS